MTDPKAPCGQPASLKHFQECDAPECLVKYQEFKALRGQAREMMARFWTKKEGK